MQKYAIINTCGHEECGQRERDPYGGYYLASDVDARIAELEKALREIVILSDSAMRDGDGAREIAKRALMVSVTK
jgi:hypothetical protein